MSLSTRTSMQNEIVTKINTACNYILSLRMFPIFGAESYCSHLLANYQNVMRPDKPMHILTLVDPCGYLPIHFAIASHNEFLFNLLVEIFSTLPTPLYYFNAPDRVGNTPLHWAILKLNYRAAVVLVQFGADISRMNDGGKTPLHLVVSQCTKDCSQTDLINHRKMVKFLITVGAKVDSHDTNNVTPLHIASELGDCAVVESLLLDGGAFINVIDDVGETPLFYALRGRHAGVVKKLIESKANLFSRNEDGETPLDFCVSNRDASMVELLNSFLNESTASFNSPNSMMSISGISLSGMSISDSSSISLSRTDEIMDVDLSKSQEMNQAKSHGAADVNATADNFRRLALF